jgi:hypothetical protein
VIGLSSAKYALLGVAVISSFFHWAGIAVTGAIIGFMSRSYKRAILCSFLFALALWLVFLGYLAAMGVAEKALSFPLIYISLALSSVIAVVSSSLRAFK